MTLAEHLESIKKMGREELKKQNGSRFFVVGSKYDFKVGDKIVLKQNGSMSKI